MKLNVTENNVKITQKELYNSGEYNIHSCEFVFSAEYDNLIKKALFTNKNQKTYKMNIINNRCQISTEVLKEKGNIEIGVYAYEVQDEELVLRYSPKPATFYIDKGSYKENAENSTPPTPTEVEQIEQEIENVEQSIDELKEEIEEGVLDGATFVPSVDNEGNISWSNNKGLPNPQTQNIKGQQGEQGIQGPQGPQGIKGDTGNDGVSPTVSMSKTGTVTTLIITDGTGQHTSEIDDGYTPVKGTDYFTTTEINEFTDTITTNVNNNLGIVVDGINGEVI